MRRSYLFGILAAALGLMCVVAFGVQAPRSSAAPDSWGYCKHHSCSPSPTPTTSTPVPTSSSPPPPSGPCGTSSVPPAHYQHVIWIWMENHSESSLSSAPYLSSLAEQCGTASDWQDAGSAYDSEPNYIAATTGLTGSALTSFNCDCPQSGSNQTTADNIFRQVRTAGLTEKSYEESMTTNCSNTDSGDYAVKHNPAVFMVGGSDRTACQADDVPMGSSSAGTLVDDIAANALPNFAFVTPNLCNDMHDCSVTTGDSFLQVLVPQILDSASYKSGNTLLIINTDEDTPVLNVVVAPSVRPGTVVTTAVGHYGELRATEESLGLPLLGEAANVAAQDLRPAFNI